MDTHSPSLLTETLYHADGQTEGEVYVYGSFLQSKMYHKGVVCSNCHEPHSLKTKGQGNTVCFQCHSQKKFDTKAHHFHEVDSVGGSCTGCHMPATTYMIIDPRHDHSIRIPRPDLSVKFGVPNACNRCHDKKSAKWAANKLEKWYGKLSAKRPHFAEALHAGRTGQPNAERLLKQTAENESVPNIARATAISLLSRYLSHRSADVVQAGLSDRDPMVRASALRTLERLGPQMRLRFAYPLLQDPVRAVRVEAARVLAAVPSEQLNNEQSNALDTALSEYIAAQMINSDRPEAHLNLGLVFIDRRMFAEAEASYKKALKLQDSFIQAYVNLADLYRALNRDQEGEKVLRRGLQIAPNNAELHHALGLVLVRQKRFNDALDSLEQASNINKMETRYAYVYGIALNSRGDTQKALAVLKSAHERRPGNREILQALASINRDKGNREEALIYIKKLNDLFPNNGPNAN